MLKLFVYTVIQCAMTPANAIDNNDSPTWYKLIQ